MGYKQKEEPASKGNFKSFKVIINKSSSITLKHATSGHGTTDLMLTE